MKYSKQRETILKIVLNSDIHPTAEMVYLEAKKNIPNISLGTVYRNLNYLYEFGLIKHIPIPNNKDRFDKTLIDHYHMLCLGCNKVFDISNNSLVHIDKVVSDDMGFEVVSHNLVFMGYCRDCKGEEK